MASSALHDHLKALHKELAAARPVDPQSHGLLHTLRADIERLLAQSPDADAGAAAGANRATAGAHESGTEESLPDRLEQIAVQFEIDHPTLAASSRRLIDLLGKAGV